VTRVTATVYEDVCTFMTIPGGILLRMRNVSDKIVEKINTHILGSIVFSSAFPTVNEIMWKYMVDTDRPQMAI